MNYGSNGENFIVRKISIFAVRLIFYRNFLYKNFYKNYIFLHFYFQIKMKEN